MCSSDLHYKVHFENFLKRFDIKEGDYYIESFLLYWLYDRWTYDCKKNNPLGYMQFVHFLKLYFPRERITNSKVAWYGVDKSITNHISEEDANDIRQKRKEFYERPQKGKKTKKRELGFKRKKNFISSNV